MKSPPLPANDSTPSQENSAISGESRTGGERADVERIFVLGAPRSGTTFLASLLENTRFGIPVESQFIVKYFERLPSYGDLALLENLERLIRDILSERAVMQWKVDPDVSALHRRLKGASGKAAYAGVIDELFLLRHEARDRIAWGDKTPHYLRRVEVLDELFPHARYLYIVRDGRDVAMSLLKKDWGPNNVFVCAEQWAKVNAENETLRRLDEEGRLLRLRYEELITDVENHLRRITEFLGEQLNEDEIVRLTNTVDAGNAGKWRETMSASQTALFEAVAEDTLQRLGYETNTSRRRSVSSIERAFHRSHDKLAWARFMFKTNVIDGFKIRFLGKEPFAD